MATVIRDFDVDADPGDAWEALSDFGALHQRLAVGFVTDCQLDGPGTRRVTFANGAVATEQLVGVDREARRLAYSVIESGLNPSHYNASAQIQDRGDGRTRFLWIVDVLPNELAPTIASMMDMGATAITQTLQQGRRPTIGT